MPAWYVTLEMAREWGLPPWQFAGGAPLIWYLRYRALYKEKARVEKKKATPPTQW